MSKQRMFGRGQSWLRGYGMGCSDGTMASMARPPHLIDAGRLAGYTATKRHGEARPDLGGGPRFELYLLPRLARYVIPSILRTRHYILLSAREVGEYVREVVHRRCEYGVGILAVPVAEVTPVPSEPFHGAIPPRSLSFHLSLFFCLHSLQGLCDEERRRRDESSESPSPLPTTSPRIVSAMALWWSMCGRHDP